MYLLRNIIEENQNQNLNPSKRGKNKKRKNTKKKKRGILKRLGFGGRRKTRRKKK